jgi:DnaJ-class molecular chaperone
VSRGQEKDLYRELGVPRDADAAAIKKAYRKLAQAHHPDRNAGNAAAEERFKRVSSAYAVLSDEKRRRDYDEFGDIAIDPNFDSDKARRGAGSFGGGFGGGFGGADFAQGAGGGFGNLFEDLFAGGGGSHPGGSPRPRKGADLETVLDLDFVEAVRGCGKRVELERPQPNGTTRRESLTVRIPSGVDDGGRIRLAGKGAPGGQGGPAGDLLARVRVRPHRYLKRTQRDLTMELPISVVEAIKGAQIELPTLEGPVTLRVPPGSNGGSRLRLRGKGVPAGGGQTAGDLYVTLRIQVPGVLGPEQTRRLEEILADDGDHWRREALS